jgi:hypothetical protein
MIVAIPSVAALTEAMEKIAQSSEKAQIMRARARAGRGFRRVYGDHWVKLDQKELAPCAFANAVAM